jgi:hypothetical protein
MKRISITSIIVLFYVITFAQSVPNGINYQAIARDANGDELTNQSLVLQLSLISDTITQALSWQESHNVFTNDFGLFNVIIGQGTSTGFGYSLTFDAVDWGSSNHYVKVEMNGMDMGTTQLMSVPYALHSGNAGPQGPTGATGPQGDSFWQDLGNGDVSTSASVTGNVGIGTGTNPLKGKLEISGWQSCCGTTQGDFWYYLYNSPGSQFQYYNGNGHFDISVYADGRFMGSGIHIFSDERTKDIVSLSNSKTDLSTLLSIEITDYKMKDKTKGDKPYKKVIAQQVKEVYPQAISLTKDVVPDIYAVASILDGYVSLETDLKVGEKVRLIFEDETSLFDVISADNNGFKVSAEKSGKVFVYGREVADFHAVDYESLSMLNVSATQELYRLILKQQDLINSLESEVAEIQKIKDDIQEIKELVGVPNKSLASKMKF